MSVTSIFISATSEDLGSAREAAKEAVTLMECRPVVQTHVAPDTRTLSATLREKIADCQAVIHLAGFRYGAEPSQPVPGQPRRSYVQMEYDAAAALGKPIYIFILTEEFPFDDATTVTDAGATDRPAFEAAELRSLQLAHRATLKNCGRHYTLVSSLAELREKLREIQLGKFQKKRDVGFMKKAAIALVVLYLGGTVTLGLQINRALSARSTAVAEVDAHQKNTGADLPAAVRHIASKDKVDAEQLARDVEVVRAAVPATTTVTGGVSIAAARDALTLREKPRNTFVAGLMGPVDFVLTAFGRIFNSASRAPVPSGPKVADHSGDLVDGYREFFDSTSDTLGSWTAAISSSWDTTWGQGTPDYRFGLICGCSFILIGLWNGVKR